MKNLRKKSIIFMVAVVMVVQMAGTAFASTIVSWTDGGPHCLELTISAERTKTVDLPVDKVSHTYGYPNEYISIPAGTTVTVVVDTTIASNYVVHLTSALKEAGADYSNKYLCLALTKVYFPTLLSTGTYKAVVVYTCNSGSWIVRGTTSAEGAPMVLQTGTFSYAPIEHDQPTYTLAS